MLSLKPAGEQPASDCLPAAVLARLPHIGQCGRWRNHIALTGEANFNIFYSFAALENFFLAAGRADQHAVVPNAAPTLLLNAMPASTGATSDVDVVLISNGVPPLPTSTLSANVSEADRSRWFEGRLLQRDMNGTAVAAIPEDASVSAASAFELHRM